jgi:NAD(P)-dependent dehydrogenase (short-subunit alcohol dehydrogenase family)
MTVGSVLILGGTGYLGQFAVLDFANKGWQV